MTFLNRQSAIEAQKALHEKKTLPGVSAGLKCNESQCVPEMKTFTLRGSL